MKRRRIALIVLAVVPLMVMSFCSSGKGQSPWDVISEPQSKPEPAAETTGEQEDSGTEVTPEKPGAKTEEIRMEPMQKEPDVDVQEISPTGPTTESPVYQAGVASWYGDGDDFNGKRTANGEIYDMNKLTAAHQKLPFHTLVEVENIENGKKVMVRINDRGPFIKGRIIDLSKRAATQLEMLSSGTADVHLRIVRVPGRKEPPKPATPSQYSPPKTTAPEPEKIETPASAPPPQTKTDQTEDPVTTTTLEEDPLKVRFYVQAGAFSSEKNAQRFLGRIKEKIPEFASIFRATLQQGLYKIVSIKMDSRDAAEEVKRRLEQKGIKAFIREYF